MKNVIEVLVKFHIVRVGLVLQVVLFVFAWNIDSAVLGTIAFSGAALVALSTFASGLILCTSASGGLKDGGLVLSTGQRVEAAVYSLFSIAVGVCASVILYFIAKLSATF